jgi:hypothetical protein
MTTVAENADACTGSNPKPTLLQCFLHLVSELEDVFAQRRTARRARRLMLSGLLAIGRRWITRAICASGREQRDWSGDYKLFSRSTWDEHDLFRPAIRRTLDLSEDDFFVVALDETGLPRGGSKVKAASWMRDPLSPPFRHNLRRGIRFLQFSALPPLHRKYGVSPRGFPVRFQMVEVVKKPAKRASKEAWEAYREERKRRNLSTHAVEATNEMRKVSDREGGAAKTMVLVADGSFCNKTVIRPDYERTVLVLRTRKDARLCQPEPEDSRRIYSEQKFTPESIRLDESIPWQTVPIFHGGAWREVRFKEMKDILWQGGAARKRLRLVVIASVPYRNSKNTRLHYGHPAYLLVTDNKEPAERFLQAYFDRWQIEVNHRDEKDTLGLGQAQVWAEKSVPRQPAFVVASYSLLLLAALEAYGPTRLEDVYDILPLWRSRADRPSCLDLVTQLRTEALAHGAKLRDDLDILLQQDAMIRKAAG